MTLTTIVLVVLAVWSLTMAVTFDKVTAGARRSGFAWLRSRRHRAEHVSSVRGRCVCGWEVQVQDGSIREDGEVEMLPPDVDGVDALEDRLSGHIAIAGATEKGWVVSLLQCPYCVAMWVAAPTAVSAVLWANNRVWQAVMLALGARAVAGVLSMQLTPPEDIDSEAVT